MNKGKPLNLCGVIWVGFGLLAVGMLVFIHLNCIHENKLVKQNQRQIIFDSNLSGNTEIHCIDTDGSGLDQLTHSGGKGRYSRVPDWSPDGRKIAFQSYRDGDIKPSIYAMDADGSNVQRLTNEKYYDGAPAWSPDGKKIAYTSIRMGKTRIYMMNADGSDLKRVTQHEGEDYYPAWSPDGERLAFVSNISNREETWDIYTMKIDGSDVRRLTHATEERRYNAGPDWSPDGRKIVFDSNRDGNDEIYVMDADGTNLQRLTQHERVDSRPNWSPDGKKITFNSDRDVRAGDDILKGEFEIYIMDSDGSNIRRLTYNLNTDGHPCW